MRHLIALVIFAVSLGAQADWVDVDYDAKVNYGGFYCARADDMRDFIAFSLDGNAMGLEQLAASGLCPPVLNPFGMEITVYKSEIDSSLIRFKAPSGRIFHTTSEFITRVDRQAVQAAKAAVQAAKAKEAKEAEMAKEAEKAEKAAAMPAKLKELDSLFSQRMGILWMPPEGDGLSVEVLIEMLPNGTISNTVVTRSSGDLAFDNSVLDALRTMGRIKEVEELDQETFNEVYRERRVTFQ